jgi:hypothetical protein
MDLVKAISDRYPETPPTLDIHLSAIKQGGTLKGQ